MDIELHENSKREPFLLGKALANVEKGQASPEEQKAVCELYKAVSKSNSRLGKAAMVCKAFGECKDEENECPFRNEGECYFRRKTPSEYIYPEIDEVVDRFTYKQLGKMLRDENNQ